MTQFFLFTTRLTHRASGRELIKVRWALIFRIAIGPLKSLLARQSLTFYHWLTGRFMQAK